MIAPPENEDEKPRRGDRVKLIGNHENAGEQGIYCADGSYYDGGTTMPVVKIKRPFGAEFRVYVPDPETQMRKLS